MAMAASAFAKSTVEPVPGISTCADFCTCPPLKRLSQGRPLATKTSCRKMTVGERPGMAKCWTSHPIEKRAPRCGALFMRLI